MEREEGNNIENLRKMGLTDSVTLVPIRWWGCICMPMQRESTLSRLSEQRQKNRSEYHVMDLDS